MKIDRAQLVALAKKAGFNASIGKTDKSGKYVPWVNAIGKDVPIEWIENLLDHIFTLPTGYLVEFTDMTGQTETIVKRERDRAIWLCQEEIACEGTAKAKCVDLLTGEVIFEQQGHFNV